MKTFREFVDPGNAKQRYLQRREELNRINQERTALLQQQREEEARARQERQNAILQRREEDRALRQRLQQEQ